MDQHTALARSLDLLTVRAGRDQENPLPEAFTGCDPECAELTETALGRKLGWAQAALVITGHSTLEEMKDLNRECSLRETTAPAGLGTTILLDLTDATLALAVSARMPALPGSATGLDHLRDMRSRMSPEFSATKAARWLGWAQCSLLASGVIERGDLVDLERSITVPGTDDNDLDEHDIIDTIIDSVLHPGAENPCDRHHTGEHWLWITDHCPECGVSRLAWAREKAPVRS